MEEIDGNVSVTMVTDSVRKSVGEMIPHALTSLTFSDCSFILYNKNRKLKFAQKKKKTEN